jgi:hypothetical protein
VSHSIPEFFFIPPFHKLIAQYGHSSARLTNTSFALPEKRQYPIPDRYHAELALRDLHNASLKDQVRIRQAIRQKFPGLI